VRRWALASWVPLGFLSVFFGVPIVLMAQQSLWTPGFSLRLYLEIIRDPFYVRVLWNTFRIAGVVTAVCLVLGFPAAYWLSGLHLRRATLYLVFVLVPYFTSILVRTYAWMVLLSNGGLINRALLTLHLTRAPIKLLYNDTGVFIGMAYVLLPYMILTLYAAMRMMDRRLLVAASVLGATPWQAFRRIFLPMTAHGVAGGCLLVFVLALGFFITPSLMGGPHQTMIAMLISTEVDQLLDWGFASALAMVLLVVTLLGILLFDRLVGLETFVEGRQ
jgi:putative spermidine/putrescine transport system permease protein